MEAVVYILSSACGIFIPRDFLTDDLGDIAEEHCIAWGLDNSNSDWWKDAADPDSDNYWDCWNWILANAKYTTPDGDIYRLHQDGDLWGVCYEKMTDEEKKNFGLD